MHSQSQTETTHTAQITARTGSYWIDTKTVEFQKSLDVGSAQVGKITARATLIYDTSSIDLLQLDGDSAIANGGTEAGEFFARRLSNPQRAERIRRARQNLGQALQNTYGELCSLAALRQKAGLSQTELAKRMDTQQPSVARWERAPGQMSLDTLTKLADALNVSPQSVFNSVIEQQKQTRQVNSHEVA